MSGPVPSPSMKGMIGSSGTISFPSLPVMAVPLVGGAQDASAMASPPPSRLQYRPDQARDVFDSIGHRHVGGGKSGHLGLCRAAITGDDGAGVSHALPL